ncbi:hypothetical protein [Deinococcus rubellus]|uniref:Chemotaxis receptor methyltransferase CheR N-terminal domain-containing protein n=1 Tax=Deinococcus rubellus TaxID=1889240 RepID=A0ABY5YJN5_9DEIO|nr:hypothetical protein [Deinococcus rubellus]UWX65330.1 hypothetical protein N0D28_06665 [Deinococcus rubellus]
MPQSAAATGVADAVLSAEALATRLYNLVHHDLNLKSCLIEVGELGSLPPEGHSGLPRILLLVRSRTGHDFSGYKPSTLVRRIDRRMKSQQIATLAEYRQQLSQTPGEVEEAPE